MAIKATEVVLDVTAIALTALLNEYAILRLTSFYRSSILALCLHPSMNTNMSSAAIPKTMKITKLCRLLKNVTLRTPSVIIIVVGKLMMIMKMPIQLRKAEFK